MNKYEAMIQRQQAEFNSLPLGFAFGEKQFEKMMNNWGLDPNEDTDKIYRIPGGGFVQKKDHAQLHEVTDKHEQELQAAIAEDETGDGFIYEMFLHELNNHEYGYTGDIEDTLGALGYTAEQIMESNSLKHGLEKAAAIIRNRED